MSRILNLSDEELSLLTNSISTIDVQEGCIEDCLICGADAGKYKGSMNWDLFERISDGILEVKGLGYDLLRYQVFPFYSSEPAHYHSFSRGVERTLFDIVERLASAHGKEVLITTSGWKHGDNYQSRAMQAIVSAIGAEKERRLKMAREEKRKPDNRFDVKISYSLKTVGALARSDYLKFVEKVLGTTDEKVVNDNLTSLEDNLDEFYENSTFIRRVKDNFRIMDGSDAKVSIQYVDECLPEHYRVFQYLFSKEFVERVFKHCNPGIIGLNAPVAFGGIGRAVTELGLNPAEQYTKKNSVISGDVSSLDIYFQCGLKINSTGDISVTHSFNFGDVYTPSLTKDLLLARAEYFEKDSPNYRHCHALANIHGRKLLRE